MFKKEYPGAIKGGTSKKGTMASKKMGRLKPANFLWVVKSETKSKRGIGSGKDRSSN